MDPQKKAPPPTMLGSYRRNGPLWGPVFAELGCRSQTPTADPIGRFLETAAGGRTGLPCSSVSLCIRHALCLPLCPPVSRTEGILGAREVKTGLVFSKYPNHGEDMPQGLESGERAGQALASAVLGAWLGLLAQQYLWGRGGGPS